MKEVLEARQDPTRFVEPKMMMMMMMATSSINCGSIFCKNQGTDDRRVFVKKIWDNNLPDYYVRLHINSLDCQKTGLS